MLVVQICGFASKVWQQLPISFKSKNLGQEVEVLGQWGLGYRAMGLNLSQFLGLGVEGLGYRAMGAD